MKDNNPHQKMKKNEGGSPEREHQSNALNRRETPGDGPHSPRNEPPRSQPSLPQDGSSVRAPNSDGTSGNQQVRQPSSTNESSRTSPGSPRSSDDDDEGDDSEDDSMNSSGQFDRS